MPSTALVGLGSTGFVGDVELVGFGVELGTGVDAMVATGVGETLTSFVVLDGEGRAVGAVDGDGDAEGAVLGEPKFPKFTTLRSQVVTSKGRGVRRTAPYAFTEH